MQIVRKSNCTENMLYLFLTISVLISKHRVLIVSLKKLMWKDKNIKIRLERYIKGYISSLDEINTCTHYVTRMYISRMNVQA